MTEIEELRKRVADLEFKVNNLVRTIYPSTPSKFYPQYSPNEYPHWYYPYNPTIPPTITCGKAPNVSQTEQC